MLTKLVILGILNRRRHYGYEIKKTIEFEMSDFDIKFGSIYHALKTFDQKELIQKVEVEHTPEGHPDRFVYEISEKGRDELDRMILGSFFEKKIKSQLLEAALHFLDFGLIEKVLPVLNLRIDWLQREKKKFLQQRKSHSDVALEKAKRSELKELNKSEKEKLMTAQKIIPKLVDNIIEHKIALTEVEIEWMKKLISQLQDFITIN
jgi:DNA-binding PadR family transcriptional regulator